MALTGEVDDRRAEINPHAVGRPRGGEQVADAATDLQDAPVRRNQKRVMPLQQLMIETLAFAEAQSSAAIIECTAIRHWPRCYNKSGQNSRVNVSRVGR